MPKKTIRPPKVKHVHKYRRVTLRGPKKMSVHHSERYDVMQCQDSGCTSFIRVELAIGKEARCNRCDNVFIMTPQLIKRRKPHCENCIKSYAYAPTTKRVSAEKKVQTQPKDKDVNKLLDSLLGDLTGLGE